MKRRKFIIGTGALAAGGAATLGSGAFSSVSADRDVTVEVADDSEAFLALEDGDSDLVTYDDGILEINLDGEGAPGEGVNMDARTAIGYVDVDSTYDFPSQYEDDYALQIRNQGTQTYETLSLTYELEDTSVFS